MSSVRYRPDLGWTLRCDDCERKRQGAYWPLTAEFWDSRNMARCRACNRDLKRQRERASPGKRRYMKRYRVDARRAIAIKNAAYYARNRVRLLAYNRAYRAANSEHVRELQRARYARQAA